MDTTAEFVSNASFIWEFYCSQLYSLFHCTSGTWLQKYKQQHSCLASMLNLCC